jgi:cyclic pyranopterin monophosphate synthase
MDSKILSHLNVDGEAQMVNVEEKAATARCAIAGCEIVMKPETLRLLRSGNLKKGDAFTVAKTAGFMAAKKTSDLIPMCHPLPVDFIEIRFFNKEDGQGLVIESEVRVTAKTGVEMEALTAASVAALTIYDMAKAVDPGMHITNLKLIKKTGGKSDFTL